MNTQLDHIVIAAADLEQGRGYIHELLGVEIPMGGTHKMMGTHNCVMTLGSGVYLELIAINPDMTPPPCPRWFGLDDPYIRKQLAQGPRLLTWAVNTPDLEILMANSNIPLGQIASAQRDDLRWKVSLSEDGRMPVAGLLPLCIQWQTHFHPSQRMADSGCRFESLTLHHPRDAWLSDALTSIDASRIVELHTLPDNQAPYMTCTIKCPHDTIVLSSKVA